MTIRRSFLFGGVLTMTAMTPAAAGDTVTFTYDALGRLVTSSVTGGPTGQANTGIAYDPAGNRTSYQVSTTGGSTPTPSPTPTPTNSPPVANPDALSMSQCTVQTRNVLANDTDPEGHYPLALVSVSGGSLGSASVASSMSITYEAYGSAGTDTVTYVVSDSLGATSSGTLTVTVTNASGCARPSG